MSDDLVLDLDADRERRSAAREGSNKGLTIRLGGKDIGTLPVEFPLDALEPLRRVDQDIALLLRQVFQMGNEDGSNPQQMTALAVDLLAYNPNLPSTFLDVIKDSATRLIGEDGINALIEYRPTSGDIAALVKGVSKFYGIGLGESPASSEAPEESDGETSSATSSEPTDSTPVASTAGRKKKAS